MRRPLTIALLHLPLLGALCDPAIEIEPPDRPPAETGDTTPPDDTQDSGDTADTQPPPPPLEGLTLELHDTIGSLVQARWEQRDADTVHAEITTADGDCWTGPSWTVEPGSQERLLLEIPYDTAVEVALVSDDSGWTSQPVAITTGEQPSGVPTMEVISAVEDRLDPGARFLLASIEEVNSFGIAIGSWTFIFDRDGRVVWALETPVQRATIHARLSWDGRELLIDHNSFYALFDWGAESQIARVTIDGTQQALYDTPGLHHPFTELPDGSIAYAATIDTYDSIVRVDASGASETVWACQPFQESLGVTQYCTSNSLVWDEDRQRYLISFYSSESVVEIDPSAGEATRWFGHLPDAWGFDPDESAWWWQHGAHFTDAGTMMVSTKIADGGEETVVREYALDEDAEILRQIWTFGEGEGIYGDVMGEAHRLGNGNTLHNYGSGTRVREITPEGELVWDVSFSSGTYLGRTEPIADLYALLP